MTRPQACHLAAAAAVSRRLDRDVSRDVRAHSSSLSGTFTSLTSLTTSLTFARNDGGYPETGTLGTRHAGVPSLCPLKEVEGQGPYTPHPHRTTAVSVPNVPRASETARSSNEWQARGAYAAGRRDERLAARLRALALAAEIAP